MPFDTQCPFCKKKYRLKDPQLDKRVTCAVAECKKVFVAKPVDPPPAAAKPAAPPAAAAPAPPPAPRPAAPAPAAPAAARTAPAAKPPAPKRPADPAKPPPPPGRSHDTPSIVDAETTAFEALADEPAAQAAVATVIPVECPICSHKWEEPRAKAGKNVLCPECQHRTKVPEPKDDAPPEDWRNKKSKLPEGAKQNFEKLEGVQGGEVKMVSADALDEAGVLDDLLEPIPLSTKIMRWSLAVGVLLGAVSGGMYWWSSRTTEKERRLFDEAFAEWQKADDASKPAAGVSSLYAAALHLGAGEYALRDRTPDRLKEALAEFAKARDALTTAGLKPDQAKAAADERHLLAAELAVAVVGLGGTPEEVAQQVRYKWLPDAPTGRQLRMNEKQITVHTELQRTLQLLLPAEFDLKLPVARRLVAALLAAKAPDLVAEIPVQLFTDAEQPEARAVVALEVLRADPSSPLPGRFAGELKAALADTKKTRFPVPASAQALWASVTPAVDGPAVAPPPAGGGGPVEEPTRIAFVTRRLVEGKPDEALALAKRPGRPDGRLRGLVAFAEWAPDPGPAFDEAAAMVKASAGKKELALPRLPLFRLSQLAAQKGKPDQAKALAAAIPEDGLRCWANAEAARARLAAASAGEKADDAWLDELPADPKRLRLGHAWGRLALARRTAKVDGGQASAVKAVDAWPAGTAHPFGLAGVALGLQDRAVGQ